MRNVRPVTDSTARYVFTVEDISTVEDRKHWVARGRLRLTDAASGEGVAEYVGFAANRSPAYVRGYSYPWEGRLACPGPERTYDRDRP